MMPRAVLLSVVFAAPIFAQEIGSDTTPSLADVLAVIDAESLDVAAFEQLIRTGAPVSEQFAAAYATPTEDIAVATRRRERALRALRAMGRTASPAGTRLLDYLSEASPEDAPALMDALSETAALGPDAGELHADALAAIAPFIKPGDGGFIERLRGGIRLHIRLSSTTPHDDIDALVSSLDATDPYEREFAAELLGRMGAAARAAIDALEKSANATDHPRQTRLPNHSLGSNFNDLIQRAAWIAIARIAPDDPRAFDGLRHLLDADEPHERVAAAMALGRIGDREAEAALLRVLNDDDPRLVAEAVTALGMIDADSTRTVDALRGLLTREDRAVVARARATLRRFGIVVPDRK